MKRATGLRGAFFINGDISIHALVKRATNFFRGDPYYPPHFNPRPREEGDSQRHQATVDVKISIHALVKRATAYFLGAVRVQFISIHALVKRATNGISFQNDSIKISIHALVKRATRLPLCFDTPSGEHFNPRPREEGDAATHVLMLSRGHFNPRPREEGDPIRCRAWV